MPERNDDALILACKVVHEANRALCIAAGDNSQVPWDELSDDLKTRTLASVTFVLANPEATPRSQHEQWAAGLVADGWTHGAVKDKVAKTHPCLVDYDALPFEQKAKDYVLNAVVGAMRHTLA